MINEHEVIDHYSAGQLWPRIEQLLPALATGKETLSWEALSPIDQFHTRGLAATRDLAGMLNIAPGESLLDIGSGLGGAARYLAATFGVSVTGIDLTPEYVEIATRLSKLTGLADRTTFCEASALALPFADASFDLAWTQHVAMNIADRPTLYRESFRVLKPGGRFALHDVLRAPGASIEYPVPWAARPEQSFVVTPDELRDLVETAGFTVLEWRDVTADSIAWIEERRRQAATGTSQLGLGAVLGPDFAPALKNLEENFLHGRVLAVEAVMQRPKGPS